MINKLKEIIIKKYIQFDKIFNSNYTDLINNINSCNYRDFSVRVEKIHDFNYLDDHNDWNYLFYAANKCNHVKTAIKIHSNNDEDKEELKRSLKIFENLVNRDIDLFHKEKNRQYTIFTFVVLDFNIQLLEIMFKNEKYIKTFNDPIIVGEMFESIKEKFSIWSGLSLNRHEMFFDTIFYLLNKNCPIAEKVLCYIIDEANCEDQQTYYTIKNRYEIHMNKKVLESEIKSSKKEKKLSL